MNAQEKLSSTCAFATKEHVVGAREFSRCVEPRSCRTFVTSTLVLTNQPGTVFVD